MDKCVNNNDCPAPAPSRRTSDNKEANETAIVNRNLNFKGNLNTTNQPEDAVMDFHELKNVLPSPNQNESDEKKGDYRIVISPPSEYVDAVLRKMVCIYLETHVTIHIGRATFICSMAVLQYYSKYFRQYPNHGSINLPEDEVPSGAFSIAYKWMLSKAPLIRQQGIVELYKVAKYLRIKQLLNQCLWGLSNGGRICEANAFFLYLDARKYTGLEDLKELLLMRISKFFLSLVAAHEFVHLTSKEVITLLSSDYIGVNSEIEVFMSAVRWLYYDWKSREQYVVDLMETVRFALIPLWFSCRLTRKPDQTWIIGKKRKISVARRHAVTIKYGLTKKIGMSRKASSIREIRIIRKTGHGPFDKILTHNDVNEMIREGIWDNTILRDNPKFHAGVLTPIQRIWIFDKQCNYHHNLECPKMKYVTYEMFLNHLEKIQKIGTDYWRTLEFRKDDGHCCKPSNNSSAMATTSVIVID